MKSIAILSVLVVACLMAFPALAAQNGKALQNRNCGDNCNSINCPYADQDGLGNQNQYGQEDDKGLAAQNGNRGENCNPDCPYGNQDGLGKQYGNQDKGRSNGDCDGDRDRNRDGSCKN